MAVRPTQSRLLGGRSTPAMRAMRFSSLRFRLSLALAVLRVDANHPDHAAPMNNLALHANLFNRCANLHFVDSVVSCPQKPAGP
jgi:hypothetical protein